MARTTRHHEGALDHTKVVAVERTVHDRTAARPVFIATLQRPLQF